MVDEAEFKSYVGPSYQKVRLSVADIMGNAEDGLFQLIFIVLFAIVRIIDFLSFFF